MKSLGGIDWIALILVIVGAVNWGLVGLMNFNMVSLIFGDMTMLSRIVYIVVGLSGLWMIYTALKAK